MKARHLVMVAAVFAAMVAAWVIAHASTTDLPYPQEQVQTLRPF